MQQLPGLCNLYPTHATFTRIIQPLPNSSNLLTYSCKLNPTNAKSTIFLKQLIWILLPISDRCPRILKVISHTVNQINKPCSVCQNCVILEVTFYIVQDSGLRNNQKLHKKDSKVLLKCCYNRKLAGGFSMFVNEWEKKPFKIPKKIRNLNAVNWFAHIVKPVFLLKRNLYSVLAA